MPAPHGLVLYYNAADSQEAAKARLVFIRMGLRVKPIAPGAAGAGGWLFRRTGCARSRSPRCPRPHSREHDDLFRSPGQ